MSGLMGVLLSDREGGNGIGIWCPASWLEGVICSMHHVHHFSLFAEYWNEYE